MTTVQKLIRNLWLIIAAPLIVGVVVGVLVDRLTGGGATRSDAGTDVRLFDLNGELASSSGPTTVGHGTGTCGAESDVDPASFVVSCGSAKGADYLTCFGAYTPEVLCVNSPWAKEAFALHVTSYYFSVGKGRNVIGIQWNPKNLRTPPPKGTEFWRPATKRPTETKPPWAMELSNGQKCVRQWRRPDQANADVRGLPVTYECDALGDISADVNSVTLPKDPVGYVIGEVDRTTNPWTVDFLASNSSATTEVTVRTAWY